MKLTIKDMNISTGDTLVGIINRKDAEEFDLHALDRVKLKKGSRRETIFLDIAESNMVPKGKIGLVEEVFDLSVFEK